jgi:hypothetical protein
MEEQPLRTKLEKLLETMKKNRVNVPLQELKTKYKKGYDALRSDIKIVASEYAMQLALYNIRVHKDHLDRIAPIVNRTIQESGILKQLSVAAFHRQDLAEFEELSCSLRERILESLEPFLAGRICVQAMGGCLVDSPDTFPGTGN